MHDVHGSGGAAERRWLWSLLLALLCLPALAAQAAPAAGKPCFADALVDPVGSSLFPTLALTDELVGIELQDGASPQSIYLLTRQMVLTERILRRSLGRSTDCSAIVDSIGSEFVTLKRNYEAFAQGSPELGIEAVASRRSQALLQQIRAQLALADQAVLKLLRKP
jgi:hypothetical protein